MVSKFRSSGACQPRCQHEYYFSLGALISPCSFLSLLVLPFESEINCKMRWVVFEFTHSPLGVSCPRTCFLVERTCWLFGVPHYGNPPSQVVGNTSTTLALALYALCRWTRCCETSLHAYGQPRHRNGLHDHVAYMRTLPALEERFEARDVELDDDNQPMQSSVSIWMTNPRRCGPDA